MRIILSNFEVDNHFSTCHVIRTETSWNTRCAAYEFGAAEGWLLIADREV